MENIPDHINKANKVGKTRITKPDNRNINRNIKEIKNEEDLNDQQELTTKLDIFQDTHQEIINKDHEKEIRNTQYKPIPSKEPSYMPKHLQLHQFKTD